MSATQTGPKKYFYARVSTKGQNLARQLKDAEEFGVDRVFSDKQSGKNFDRAGYEEMISELNEGDLVVVSSLDRLGRNYDEIGVQWEIITKEIKADVVVLDMPLLDTRTGRDLTGTLIADIPTTAANAIALNLCISVLHRFADIADQSAETDNPDRNERRSRFATQSDERDTRTNALNAEPKFFHPLHLSPKYSSIFSKSRTFIS